MSVYLERIELSSYRSCKKTSINLNKNLSALIGVNGSGKSNILNGLLLLKKITRIQHRRVQSDSFLSGCKLGAHFNVEGKTYKYSALIQFATDERNMDEVIHATEKWSFKDITGEGKWVKLPLAYASDFYDYGKVIRPTGRGYTYVRFDPFSNFKLPRGANGEVILSALRKIANFVYGISYYSASRFTDPSKCPASIEIESDRLSRRYIRPGADEHIQFMYDLYTAHKSNDNEYQEFISLVSGEGIGLVEALEFTEVEAPSNTYQVITGGRLIRKEVKRTLVIPSITINGNTLSFNQLSEGTFKTLGILFYIITDKSKLLLLEEPEVCIHHGLLASVIEIIKSFSRQKQIVISTHSDFVLDALDPSNVFIVRNTDQRGTVVKPVSTAISASQYKALRDYLDNTGNLGEYWRSGELEG